MNDQELDRRVRKDTEKVQKDLLVLAKDVAARVNSFQESVSHSSGKANKEITRQVESSVSSLSKGFEQVTGDASKALADTSAQMKKVVGERVSRFTKQAHKASVAVPKDLGKQASRFPLVVVTIGLAVGFLLGLIFLPTRQSVEAV